MDRKLKHLEFIQNVINRLSTNSFLLKGWSVILVSALFALGAANADGDVVLLAYVPAVVFWGLDGYFLGLERAYRRLYEEVRAKQDEQIDFAMSTSHLPRGAGEWLNATLSKTLIPFHWSVLGALLVVTFVVPR